MNKHVPPVISGAFYACLPMLCSCLLFAIAACEGNAAMPDEREPNVIVILADDLGYGDLSCYGADDIATPNIDRMADEGAKFNSFYVSPVCSPTRASLMTGIGENTTNRSDSVMMWRVPGVTPPNQIRPHPETQSELRRRCLQELKGVRETCPVGTIRRQQAT